MKPQFQIRTRPLIGALCDKEYAVYHQGQFVGARLSFIGNTEAAEMVRVHLLPKAPLPEMTSHAYGVKDSERSRKGASNAGQANKARRPMRDVFDDEAA